MTALVEGSIVGTVRLDKKEYAISLIWNSFEEGGIKPVTQAKLAAERTECGLYTIRRAAGNKKPFQYGLGSFSLLHRSGMQALAASIADVVDSSIYGVWLLDDRIWWLVGIRNDGIILYDLASYSEDDIRKQFELGLNDESWEKVICPGDWNIPDSHPSEEVVPLLGKPRAKLKEIKLELKRFLLWGGGVIFILASGVMVKDLLNTIITEEKVVSLPLPLPPPAPWLGKAVAMEYIKACTPMLKEYVVDATGIPGWQPIFGKCTNSNLSYQLQRKGGLDHWLIPMAKKISGMPLASVEPIKNLAYLTWSLPTLQRYEENSRGNENLQLVSERLKMEFDELGIPVEIRMYEGVWPHMEILIVFKQSPDLFLPLFAQYSATVISEIAYDLINNEWTLRANFYGRLKN